LLLFMFESSTTTNTALLNILALSKDATAVYTDIDLHIAFANDVMIALWGKNRTVIGKRLGDAIPELDGQPFIAMLKTVWHTGKTIADNDVEAILEVNGQLQSFYFDFEYRALLNEQGATYAILHTTTNVTERFRARELEKERERREQELNEELMASNEELTALNEEYRLLHEEQASMNEELYATNEELADTQTELLSANLKLNESQTRLRNVLEQAPLGMCVLRGPQHVIEIANEAILTIWGRTRAEVMNKPHREARPELAGQPVFRWLDQVYSTGKRQVNREFKVWLRKGDGLREAIVNSIYEALKDSEGNINGILIVLEDITEIVEERRQAIRVQEMFNIAIEAGELGAFYYNPQSNQFTGNETLKKWFGLGKEESMDLQLATDVIADEDRDRVGEAIAAALNPAFGGVYDVEYTIVHPYTHAPRIVKAKGKARFDDQGNALSLNGMLLDITERKQDEQRKNDFISMVSHELKTPITSLKGYLQLLEKRAQKSDDAFTTGALNKSLRQVTKMTSMINGFLNMSRLESGKIHIDKSLFDMAGLVKEAEEESLASITSHQVVFAPVEPTPVIADRDKIGQVITNLINNAVKYSPQDSIINVACVTVNNMAMLSVQDQGIGIAPDNIEHLFDRFYRVESKDTKSIAGFGIGLYICKEIIDRHKGTIAVKSEVGKGSTFYFTLPVEVK
jgi:two-component system sensor histidine kinase VicK